MSDIADRYRRLSGEFADKVAQVSPERWGAPSPCEDWTARDVVAHIVDVHGIFLGLVGRPFERTIECRRRSLGALREAFGSGASRSRRSRAGERDVRWLLRADELRRCHRSVRLFRSRDPRMGSRARDRARRDNRTRRRRQIRAPTPRRSATRCTSRAYVAQQLTSRADADDQTKLLALLGRHV